MDISDPGSVTSSGSQQSLIPSATSAISSVEMALLEHRLIHATQKIIAAYTNAERVKTAQTRFMAVACHDLRQPLARMERWSAGRVGAGRARTDRPVR